MVRKTKIHLICNLGTHKTIEDCQKANPLKKQSVKNKKNFKNFLFFKLIKSRINKLFLIRMASNFLKKTSPWYFIILSKKF